MGMQFAPRSSQRHLSHEFISPRWADSRHKSYIQVYLRYTFRVAPHCRELACGTARASVMCERYPRSQRPLNARRRAQPPHPNERGSIPRALRGARWHRTLPSDIPIHPDRAPTPPYPRLAPAYAVNLLPHPGARGPHPPGLFLPFFSLSPAGLSRLNFKLA